MEFYVVVLCAFEAVEMQNQDVRRSLDETLENSLCVLAFRTLYLDFDTDLGIGSETDIQSTTELINISPFNHIALIFSNFLWNVEHEVVLPVHSKANFS